MPIQVLPVASGCPSDNECSSVLAATTRCSSEQASEEIHAQEGQLSMSLFNVGLGNKVWEIDQFIIMDVRC